MTWPHGGCSRQVCAAYPLLDCGRRAPCPLRLLPARSPVLIRPGHQARTVSSAVSVRQVVMDRCSTCLLDLPPRPAPQEDLAAQSNSLLLTVLAAGSRNSEQHQVAACTLVPGAPGSARAASCSPSRRSSASNELPCSEVLDASSARSALGATGRALRAVKQRTQPQPRLWHTRMRRRIARESLCEHRASGTLAHCILLKLR